uniref:DNA-directed RNA polymerase subunit alpha n=1 Tax=Cuspidaria floribunda TaxID=354071 RepID=A0A2P1GCF5_9LAMI|nr:RNA polymerase alpha subunit [Cuspidaria floribunda]
MIPEKITISTRTRQWKCIKSIEYDKCLLYGRFILAPLMEGQADTIGIAMRRTLLGEIEGTYITCVKSENVIHEYSTITGVEELVYDVVVNLNKIVLRSNLYGTCEGSICVRGPGEVTAQDIILPPYIEIVDNTQHIATLTEPINLCIEVQIEKKRGFYTKIPYSIREGSYSSTTVAVPVRTVNYNLHSYRNGNERQEILFLEIWTNGSLTPKEALQEASRKLIDLFIPFLRKEGENFEEEEGFVVKDNKYTIPFFGFHDKWDKLRKKKTKLAMKSIFIDQFGFSTKVYNCLKKSNISTLFDLVNKNQKDLMKIEHFDLADVKEIFYTIEEYFEDLPNDLF